MVTMNGMTDASAPRPTPAHDPATGNPASTLARYATVHLDTGVRAEADTRGLAPTASSTVTLALGDALAVALADLRGFTREDFGRFHPGGSLGKQFEQHP